MGDVAMQTARPPRTTGQRVDVVVTIVLLVGLAAFAAVASTYGLFVSLVSDGCFDRCSPNGIMAGVVTAVLAPLVAGIAALVVAIVRMVRRRLAWWVPLVGAVGVVGGWLAGAGIATAAAG